MKNVWKIIPSVLVILFVVSLCAGLFRLTVKFGAMVVGGLPGILRYDDFNDGVLGTNLGGGAGAMSYDGAHDPSLSFVSGYEGTYALKISYSVPVGQWCGYWSFFLASQKGYDIGMFTDIRMWVKGENGGENFKIELKDEFGTVRTVYISMVPGFESGLSTSWRELVIPLYNFPDLNLYYVKQVNIIFDTYPYSGTIYIDNIVFTQFSPYTPSPIGLVFDDFNGGLGPNRLGGSNGTMDPNPGDPTEWITASYVTDSYEGLGALKLTYNRGAASWVGYWSFMRPDQTGYDVSDYENLCMWVKGASGGERFKVELKDTSNNTSSIYVTVPGTTYQKISIPLSDFTGLDLKNLKQVNIVFDTSPNSGTVYIDLVLFEWDVYKEAQKRAFLYFWREMNPQTGLVPDKNRDKMASIAATGFGLSAICVGESRGWISRQEAMERVLKALRFLRDNAEKVNGMPYHFLHVDNGSRFGTSEISIIDTAMLMAGVLHVAEHFKENQQIVSLAEEIFNAVDWYWFVRPSGTFDAAWSPEIGFYGERFGYDEYILAGIIGLGSSTKPLPRSSWDVWRSGYKWASYENYTFLCPGGYMRPTSYLYHFPASWIDFRNKHDNYVDYWDTMVNALLANREYCRDWAENYPEYDDNLWGWNACEGPEGYLGWDPFRGTIAPSAVVGSVPFFPDFAVPDVRYIYEHYGENIWGIYGFKDSMDSGYNSGRGWFCENFVGINKGPEVLLPEAYISGLVWKEMMNNFYILEGLRKAGFVWRIYPSDDTFVDNVYPNTNYGQQSQLKIENSSSSIKLTYMKFDLSGLPSTFGIGEARLNLFVYENAQAYVIAYGVENDAWTENSLVWNNRPPHGEIIDNVQCENGWISLDVTQWARAQFNIDRKLSLVLAISQGSASFRSDEYMENRSQRPYLGVKLASTRTVTERLLPIEDTYTDYEKRNTPMGENNPKRLAVSGVSGYYRRSYLKFDMSSLPKEAKISEARLWVYAREIINPGNPVKVVYTCRLENDNWKETTLTWNTQPENGPVISENSISTTGWISWDVTAWVQNQMSVDNIVSIILRTIEPANTVEPWFESKEEVLGHIPFLEIKYYELRGAPVLLSPENNATTFDNTPTFTWIPGGGAESHILQIDNDPDFSSPVYENRNLAGNANQCTIENELAQDNYYWRVGAVFEGTTVWSESRRLQVLRSMTLVIYPSADAKVESSSPDTNYGNETHIAAAAPNPSFYRRSFLKFDLSSIPSGGSIIDAKLYLYKYGEGGTEPGDTNRNVGVYRVDNDDWSESVITWNNQPAIGSLENYIYTPTSTGFWEVWNITNWADNQYKGDRILSIAIRMVDERSDWNSAEPYWYSKEWGTPSQRPYLVVTVS
ncbi:MAG: DNRLRE domain-containing protein [Candidatus Hadarchaeales archaeon]